MADGQVHALVAAQVSSVSSGRLLDIRVWPCYRSEGGPKHWYVQFTYTCLLLHRWLTYVLSQDAKLPGVTLDNPPKTRLFASYWGPNTPLTDGDHPEPASEPIKKKTAPDPVTALANALAQATQPPPLVQHSAVDEERNLQNFMLNNEDRFPETIEFLKSLTEAEAGRGNGRDWIVFSDKLTTTMGFLHIGHILLWTNEAELQQHTGMAPGQAKYFLLKVRAHCMMIMAAEGSIARASAVRPAV